MSIEQLILENIFNIISAGIIIPLLIIALKRTIHLLKTDNIEISINVSEELLNTGAKFGLLHVRDGKDEDPDRGPKKNKKRWFKKIDKRGNLRTSVRYTKNLGFQFKCFADYREINFDRFKEMLEKNKYRNVSKGEGKVKNRAYFIHYGHPTCKSIEGFENNYFYPE